MTGLAKNLRSWLRTRYRRTFTAAQAAEALGLKPGVERQALLTALSDFTRRGEIERLAPGRFRIVNPASGPKKSPSRVYVKIARAVYFTRGVFTQADIARISGAKPNTVTAFITRKAADYLQLVGLRVVRRGRVKVYRLRASQRDEFYKAFIRSGEV